MTVEHIRCGVLIWDYGQQPDIGELTRILADVSGGTMHLSQVATGSSDYAIVVSDKPLTEAEAYASYREDLDGAPFADGDER